MTHFSLRWRDEAKKKMTDENNESDSDKAEEEKDDENTHVINIDY